LDRLCPVYEGLIEPLIQAMCWHGIFVNTGLEGRRKMLNEDGQALRHRLGAATVWREIIG